MSVLRKALHIAWLHKKCLLFLASFNGLFSPSKVEFLFSCSWEGHFSCPALRVPENDFSSETEQNQGNIQNSRVSTVFSPKNEKILFCLSHYVDELNLIQLQTKHAHNNVFLVEHWNQGILEKKHNQKEYIIWSWKKFKFNKLLITTKLVDKCFTVAFSKRHPQFCAGIQLEIPDILPYFDKDEKTMVNVALHEAPVEGGWEEHMYKTEQNVRPMTGASKSKHPLACGRAACHHENLKRGYIGCANKKCKYAGKKFYHEECQNAHKLGHCMMCDNCHMTCAKNELAVAGQTFIKFSHDLPISSKQSFLGHQIQETNGTFIQQSKAVGFELQNKLEVIEFSDHELEQLRQLDLPQLHETIRHKSPSRISVSLYNHQTKQFTVTDIRNLPNIEFDCEIPRSYAKRIDMFDRVYSTEYAMQYDPEDPSKVEECKVSYQFKSNNLHPLTDCGIVIGRGLAFERFRELFLSLFDDTYLSEDGKSLKFKAEQMLEGLWVSHDGGALWEFDQLIYKLCSELLWSEKQNAKLRASKKPGKKPRPRIQQEIKLSEKQEQQKEECDDEYQVFRCQSVLNTMQKCRKIWKLIIKATNESFRKCVMENIEDLWAYQDWILWDEVGMDEFFLYFNSSTRLRHRDGHPIHRVGLKDNVKSKTDCLAAIFHWGINRTKSEETLKWIRNTLPNETLAKILCVHPTDSVNDCKDNSGAIHGRHFVLKDQDMPFVLFSQKAAYTVVHKAENCGHKGIVKGHVLWRSKCTMCTMHRNVGMPPELHFESDDDQDSDNDNDVQTRNKTSIQMSLDSNDDGDDEEDDDLSEVERSADVWNAELGDQKNADMDVDLPKIKLSNFGMQQVDTQMQKVNMPDFGMKRQFDRQNERGVECDEDGPRNKKRKLSRNNTGIDESQ